MADTPEAVLALASATHPEDNGRFTRYIPRQKMAQDLCSFLARWHLADDGVLHQVVIGEVLAADGAWVMALFLLDTGADRTVFSADTLAAVGLAAAPGWNRSVAWAAPSIRSLWTRRSASPTKEAAKLLFADNTLRSLPSKPFDMSVFGRG